MWLLSAMGLKYFRSIFSKFLSLELGKSGQLHMVAQVPFTGYTARNEKWLSALAASTGC